jgi:hypothetical protein
MVEVSGSYIVSVLLVAFVLVISVALGFVLRRQGRRARLFFNVAGTLLIGVAVLEKIGWSVHPWVAGSPAQAWDDTLFRILWLIGLGLLLISWTISFYTPESGSGGLRRLNADPVDRRVSKL